MNEFKKVAIFIWYLEGSKVVLEESVNKRPINYSLYGSILLFILLHLRLPPPINFIIFISLSLMVYKMSKQRQEVDYGQQLRQQRVDGSVSRNLLFSPLQRI